MCSVSASSVQSIEDRAWRNRDIEGGVSSGNSELQGTLRGSREWEKAFLGDGGRKPTWLEKNHRKVLL